MANWQDIRALGNNKKQAMESLINDNPWIEECGFDSNELICRQLMTEDNKRDIKTVVEYLFQDEYKHFQEEGKPNNHIYQTLLRLKAIL